MTSYLRDIISDTLSKEGFQKHFYEELVELVNDEDLQVRLEGIEVAVEIIPAKKLSEEQIEADVVPAFLRHLDTVGEEDCDLTMSALYGKFLISIPLDKVRKSSPSATKSFVSFFSRVYKSPNRDVRRNIAMSLPCFFYYFYGNNSDNGEDMEQQQVDVFEIYSELAQDEDIEIRQVVAKGIHEVLEIIEKSGKDPFLIEESFTCLLSSHTKIEV